jgi:hypothetical protein
LSRRKISSNFWEREKRWQGWREEKSENINRERTVDREYIRGHNSIAIIMRENGYNLINTRIFCGFEGKRITIQGVNNKIALVLRRREDQPSLR